ncbi:MAG TPA: hypothetical protein VFC19_08590 [Candidatus Limnocylindrales bacterium]|nr:hypothetical protein [Candidatus Limnocylindrales bacterium]
MRFESFTERIGGPAGLRPWRSGLGVSTPFAEDNAAMHLIGSGEYTRQLNQIPDFTKTKVARANFPTMDGGKCGPDAVAGTASTSTP